MIRVYFLFRVYHELKDRRIFKFRNLVSFGDTNVLPHVDICPMFVEWLILPSQLRGCWGWVPRWGPCFIKSSPIRVRWQTVPGSLEVYSRAVAGGFLRAI